MNEDQRMAVDGLRKYLDAEVEPEIREYLDSEKFIPTERMTTFQKGLIDFGLITAPHPEEYGGMGLDWTTHLMLFEEVAATSIDLAVPILINTVCADLLIHQAPEYLCKKYVPGLLSGELMAALAISEPDVGSDVAAVKTRAVRDDDHFTIDGEKTWISNAEYSDFIITTVRVSGEDGLSHLLVDRKSHGYEVRGIPKIAMNSQSTGQVFFSNARVPIQNTVGDMGHALRNTLVVFERARLHMAAWGYGLARRALEESIRYAQDRTQHGKPIAGHQLIAEKVATIATEVDAARLLTLRAAAMIDEGKRCDAECAMAKWFGTELAARATRQAVQIHGGNGVTKEYIVERLAREGIIAPIPDGTTEIQKLIIARSLTGVSAFR